MKRSPRARLNDLLSAAEAIAEHLGAVDIDEGMRFDAIRMRLFEIGEATKALPTSLLETEPGVAWSHIARMRDHLAHHYFDTAHAVVLETARASVPALAEATRRILASLDQPDPNAPGPGSP